MVGCYQTTYDAQIDQPKLSSLAISQKIAVRPNLQHSSFRHGYGLILNTTCPYEKRRKSFHAGNPVQYEIRLCYPIKRKHSPVSGALQSITNLQC